MPQTMMRTVAAAALAMAIAPGAFAQGPASPPGSPAGQAIVTHVQTAGELGAVCDPAWTGVPRLEAIAYCRAS